MGDAYSVVDNMLGRQTYVNYNGSTVGVGGVESMFDGVTSKDDLFNGHSKQESAQMFFNWLTGGQPKNVDPSKIFKDASLIQPQEQRAAVGAGINGMFGVGLMIGEIAPMAGPEPIKPIAAINQSPMQAGVPYSVPPVPSILKPPGSK